MESLEFVNSLKDTLITYTCERGTFDTTIQHAYTKEMEQLETGLQELAQYRALAEQIGCPLDVLAKLVLQNCFYDGNKYIRADIGFVNEEEDKEAGYRVGESAMGEDFWIKDYKKTWWLKQDRSE